MAGVVGSLHYSPTILLFIPVRFTTMAPRHLLLFWRGRELNTLVRDTHRWHCRFHNFSYLALTPSCACLHAASISFCTAFSVGLAGSFCRCLYRIRPYSAMRTTLIYSPGSILRVRLTYWAD